MFPFIVRLSTRLLKLPCMTANYILTRMHAMEQGNLRSVLKYLTVCVLEIAVEDLR